MQTLRELTEVDMVVMKKVLKNFLNGGQYYEELEYYEQEELMHRSREVLNKLVDIPDRANKNKEE